MFLRVNGLFGWIQANDRRSILLFAGFLVALNIAAVLTLYLPLAAFDLEHAPVFAWGGYLTRYVPLVTLAAAAVFALQMLWHVKSVQRLVAFRFVDNADEPRLCRIVEPLAINMGLPAPYVGVVETPALNAFACGFSRKSAVVVVTRGLIEGLDDDELAAVIAHELAHIANGDIRMMAAANSCLRMIGWLVRPRMKHTSRVQELVAFPMVMFVLPPVFLFVLIVCFSAQLALRGAHLVRLLISSSREFIADAASVEATQNPAALVSALQRIEGRSLLAVMPPGQDAMMIDGATDGAFATHPTIAQRVHAIISVTGSMALIAPSRRDTRPAAQRAASGFGRRSVAPAPDPLSKRDGALHRIAGEDGRNWLGLTPTMSVGALLALVLFAGMHRNDLDDPAALASALDPRPFNAAMIVASRGMACNFGVVALLPSGGGGGGGAADPCSAKAMQALTAEHAQVGGPVGNLLASMIRAPEGMYTGSNGSFSSTPAPDVEAAAVRSKRCFRTEGYHVGDRGMHGVNDKPGYGGEFDLRRWLASIDVAASMVTTARPQDRDAALKTYVERRKTIFQATHRFFGEPGLVLAASAFGSPAHQNAIDYLRTRLRDPSFTASLPPVLAAEMALLAERPSEFMSCVARKASPAA